MCMKKFLLAVTASVLSCVSSFGALSFEGNSHRVISVNADASTGLEMIYVLYSTSGVSVVSGFGTDASWQTFGSMGGAYAEDVPGNGLTLGKGDTGVIVKDSQGRQHCYWIVDYSIHQLELHSLVPDTSQPDCERVTLALDGSAAAIPYYTINGRHAELGRELQCRYFTQRFDEETFSYVNEETTVVLDGVGALFGIPAPLADTHFELSGDRFLLAWGYEDVVSTDLFHSVAVGAESRAEQTERDNANEQKDDAASGLGGSAPCEITFSAATSDGVVFHEWQISRTADFEIPENTFTDEEFTYTFSENGTFYVRFVANNAAGTCESIGTVFEVLIGESRLDIPNAFSPGSSPGVNDEWKVSYKSLVEFDCHIFNRWGLEMCHLTDPSQGWDGTYRGKLVPPGAYYYVIKARGADGIEYKKAGDINIINFKSSAIPGGENAEGAEM